MLPPPNVFVYNAVFSAVKVFGECGGAGLLALCLITTGVPLWLTGRVGEPGVRKSFLSHTPILLLGTGQEREGDSQGLLLGCGLSLHLSQLSPQSGHRRYSVRCWRLSGRGWE